MADQSELETPVDEPIVDPSPAEQQSELEFSGDSDADTTAPVESRQQDSSPVEPQPDMAQVREQIAYLQRQNFRLQQQAADHAYRYQQSLKQAAPPTAKEDGQWYDKHWSPPKGVSKQTFLPWVDQTTGDWKPDTPPQIRQQHADWKAYHDSFDEKFRENPLDYMYQGLREKFLTDAREEFSREQERFQEEQFAHQMVSSVADWAMAKDAAGNPIYYRDEQTGVTKAAMTPDGQRFSQLLTHFRQYMPLQQASDVAWAKFAQEKGIGQQQAAAQVQPPDPVVADAERKKNFTNQRRAPGHAPDRGQKIKNATDPLAHSSGKSLADMIRDQIAAGELTADEAVGAF